MKKLAVAGGLTLVFIVVDHAAVFAQAAGPVAAGATESSVAATLQSWFAALPGLVSQIVAVASVLAAFMPQATPGSVWSYLRGAIDFLAFNFGNAKNAAPASIAK